MERYAINAGAAFALAGDLIVAGREGWLQVGEVRLGMHAPMNLAWLVARYPVATVLQIVLTGNRIPATELRRLGVAHEVVDDPDVRDRAIALAEEIASFPPGAARRLKSATLQLAASDAIGGDWFELAASLAPASAPPPTRPS